MLRGWSELTCLDEAWDETEATFPDEAGDESELNFLGEACGQITCPDKAGGETLIPRGGWR